MKKLILTIAIVTGLATTIFSQTTQVFQPDTAILLYDHSVIEEGDTMRLIMTYNIDGLFSTCERYYIDDGFKAGADIRLPIQNRTMYEYDMANNLDKMTVQHYSGWRPPRYISDYIYEYGKRVMYVRHYDDIYDEEYVTTDSVLYQYDPQGRLLHETCYKRNQSLYHSNEIDYSYDNNVIEKTTYGLSHGHWGDWVTLEIKTQTFGDDETLLTVETESYENPTTLETYSYDGDGHNTSILTQTLTDGEWVNAKLLEYTYDSNGYLILAEIKSWQEGEFVHAHRAVYEPNEAGYPTVIDFQTWNGEAWEQGTWKAGFYIFKDSHLSRQNAFLCRADAKHIEISYTNTELPTYEVEEHPTEQSFATIHPNPTTGLVTITGKDLKQAEVLNTLGQQVATTQGQGETLQIDIANLPSGVYFVRVTDEEGRTCVRKVMKE